MKHRLSSGVLRRMRSILQPLQEATRQLTGIRRSVGALNLAPQTGRRDAAFDHTVSLVLDNIFAGNDQYRLDAYHRILSMLEETIDSTVVICSIQDDQHGESENDFLLYLLLLRDNVQAAAALLHQQVTMNQDVPSSSLIGRELFGSLRDAGEIIAESEFNLYQCVCKIIELSAPKIMKYREYSQRVFSRSDLKRYQRAGEEYRQVFSRRFPLGSAEKTQ